MSDLPMLGVMPPPGELAGHVALTVRHERPEYEHERTPV